MGDYYQTIADLDANVQTAESTVERLREWMISQQIIVADRTNCVLSKKTGHSPGKNYALATNEPDSNLLKLRINGVAFITERTVFYSMTGENILVCAECKQRFESNDDWSKAVGEWYHGNGPGILPCEHCGARAAITQWQHDPPWAFGYVGIEFWNWPPLRENFLRALEEVVDHRFCLVYGKI